MLTQLLVLEQSEVLESRQKLTTIQTDHTEENLLKDIKSFI